MNIVVIHKDVTALEVDAVVVPTSVQGDALSGISSLIRSLSGLLSLAAPALPIPIGSARLTPAGKLPCRFLIHTATVGSVQDVASLENLKQATVAAIKCAEENHLRSLAFPDLGLLALPSSTSRAARAILSVMRAFDSSSLDRILLADPRDEVVRLSEAALEALQASHENDVDRVSSGNELIQPRRRSFAL
jgi:O-acetyl-ADP-ribose deacetylase (regulator of RNase III)